MTQDRKRFPPNSRYHDTPIGELPGADGEPVAYLRRRFAPDPTRFVTLQYQKVAQGNRIDRMAAGLLGDPEQFWRLADANGSLDALDLERTGSYLRLTLPEGMEGPGDA